MTAPTLASGVALGAPRITMPLLPVVTAPQHLPAPSPVQPAGPAMDVADMPTQVWIVPVRRAPATAPTQPEIRLRAVSLVQAWAHGAAEPLALHLWEPWLDGLKLSGKSRQSYRADLRRFLAWAQAQYLAVNRIELTGVMIAHYTLLLGQAAARGALSVGVVARRVRVVRRAMAWTPPTRISEERAA